MPRRVVVAALAHLPVDVRGAEYGRAAGCAKKVHANLSLQELFQYTSAERHACCTACAGEANADTGPGDVAKEHCHTFRVLAPQRRDERRTVASPSRTQHRVSLLLRSGGGLLAARCHARSHFLSPDQKTTGDRERRQ